MPQCTNRIIELVSFGQDACAFGRPIALQVVDYPVLNMLYSKRHRHQVAAAFWGTEVKLFDRPI